MLVVLVALIVALEQPALELNLTVPQLYPTVRAIDGPTRTRQSGCTFIQRVIKLASVQAAKAASRGAGIVQVNCMAKSLVELLTSSLPASKCSAQQIGGPPTAGSNARPTCPPCRVRLKHGSAF